MYNLEENRIINLQDSYTLFYSFLAKNILETCNQFGETALREGIRRYGMDRGLAARQKHIDLNVKINMHSLMTISNDLPSDPRFKRIRKRLNSQVYESRALVCPIANLWSEYGVKDIGRIYCEEFHLACYSSYAYGFAKVDMTHTITQEGDEYCLIKNTLRPENLPDELKPLCFEEYDPNYVKTKIEHLPIDGKKGFNTLCIKLFYYLLETAKEKLGDKGITAIKKGLNEISKDAILRLEKSAIESCLSLNRDFVHYNYPLYLDTEQDPIWEKYDNYGAKQLLKDYFLKDFLKELNFD